MLRALLSSIACSMLALGFGAGGGAIAAAAPAGAGPAATATGARANAGGAASPAASAASAPAGLAARFAPVPGPYAVEAMNLDWFDQDRNRQVPARVYFPRHAPGPFPVVVFSSGLGAGRNHLEFLGRHLASHGYVSVHVQHLGSDDQAAKGGAGARAALIKAARDPRTGLTRLLDLVFALDQVGALAAGSPVLRGRIDLGAVAVGGNNLGAWTALAAAGLAVTGKDGEESSLPDPRVKAALLFAPPPPVRAQLGQLRFEHVKVPCLHVIGALPGGGKQAGEGGGRGDPQQAFRRAAFDRISGADQLLVMALAARAPGGGDAGVAGRAAAAGGTAAGTGGAGGAAPPERDATLQGPIKAISTAFLDAYLRHDAAARDWLLGGGLAAWLGGRFHVEAHAR